MLNNQEFHKKNDGFAQIQVDNGNIDNSKNYFFMQIKIM